MAKLFSCCLSPQHQFPPRLKYLFLLLQVCPLMYQHDAVLNKLLQLYLCNHRHTYTKKAKLTRQKLTSILIQLVILTLAAFFWYRFFYPWPSRLLFKYIVDLLKTQNLLIRHPCRSQIVFFQDDINSL